MVILGLLQWWYGAGWKKVTQMRLEKLVIAEDYFSIDILLRTLFSPFRQISADSSGGGPLGDKIRAWFDKLFSRFIGAAVRIILIFVGTLWLAFHFVISLAMLLVWPLLPVLPFASILLSLTGWMPWV